MGKNTTWNDIPFDENADGKTKAREFDLQVDENTDLEAGVDPLTDYQKQTEK